MRSSPDPGLNGTQVFSNTGPLAGPGEIRIFRCLGIDWKQEKKGRCMMKPEEKISLLKQAWKEVFGVEEVADDADFFEEGGDSIMAVQLSSWLVQKGVKLDLGKIFYTPVLSDMAETLEETDAMFVPEEFLTKDIVQKKIDEVMREPSSTQTAADQQICDPEMMQQAAGAADGQQICDPEMMQQSAGASDGQQICDPEMMQQSAGAAGGQQICDPEMMQQTAGAADDQQICDPEMMQQTAAVPNQQAYSQKMMQAMLKLMISQQQTMLQMMEIMADLISPSVSQPTGKFPMRHMPGPSFRPGTKSGNHVPFMKQMPDEKKEKMKKAMEPYVSRKVDHPIEQPTVIGITKAKVSKPVKSAEAVLEQVLSALLKNGFSKTEDLFEQGLTSLDTVKIVTRCGEHGYSVKMQDIYMHSTFDELVKCMTPGK